MAYQKRFDIEEMFRDFKSGGYSLEGSQLAPQYLSKLIIVIAIAYTSATMQGKKIKDMGIQKYVTRPEKRYNGNPKNQTRSYQRKFPKFEKDARVKGRI